MIRVNKQVITKLPKNDTSIRTVTLPVELFRLLNEYRQWWLEYKLYIGGTCDRLFIQTNGTPIFPTTINQWLRSFAQKHNLPKLTPHSLRHKNITLQIMAGVPIRQVSARSGHSNASTTSDINSHAINSMDVVAGNKLAEILG